MAQSLSCVIVHIIFSTKDRRPLIIKSVRDDLHRYLANTVRNNDCECYRVGGVEDHVHLAVRLKSTMDVSKLIEHIKSSSSKWIKGKAPGLDLFAWQKGYGAFSVSPQYRKEVIAYIDDQEEHHKTVSFQDEFRNFLRQYEIEYSEEYVWG